MLRAASFLNETYIKYKTNKKQKKKHAHTKMIFKKKEKKGTKLNPQGNSEVLHTPKQQKKRNIQQDL